MAEVAPRVADSARSPRIRARARGGRSARTRSSRRGSPRPVSPGRPDRSRHRRRPRASRRESRRTATGPCAAGRSRRPHPARSDRHPRHGVPRRCDPPSRAAVRSAPSADHPTRVESRARWPRERRRMHARTGRAPWSGREARRSRLVAQDSLPGTKARLARCGASRPLRAARCEGSRWTKPRTVPRQPAAPHAHANGSAISASVVV